MHLGEMFSLSDILSQLMLHRPFELRRVVITQKHQDMVPQIEEEVGGGTGLVLEVFSTDDLEDGWLPTNREIQELHGLLDRKPYWWEVKEPVRSCLRYSPMSHAHRSPLVCSTSPSIRAENSEFLSVYNVVSLPMKLYGSSYRDP